MKKKILLGLLMILMTLCVGLLAGCFLFDGNNGGTGNNGETGDNRPPSTDTGLQAPEHVRLDMIEKILYVPDCSASGVKQYDVQQRYKNVNNVVVIKDWSLNTTNLKAEDGFFAINVKTIDTPETFTLTITCGTGIKGGEVATKTFTFKRGASIVYDADHCTFDKDTGLFTWTAVEGAAGYLVRVSATVSVTVTEPQFVADDDVNSFSVIPLYDGYTWGEATRIYLGNGTTDVSPVYDYEKEAFVWTKFLNGRYKVEITEDGKTTTHELTQNVLPYVPTSTSVTFKITVLGLLGRDGVQQVTLPVLSRVSGITISPSRVLTWDAVDGADEYKINLQFADGTKRTEYTTQPNLTVKTFLDDSHKVGTATAEILPLTREASIAWPSDFTFFVVDRVGLVTPTLTRDAQSGKLVVSIPSDSTNVERYAVTVNEQALEAETASNGATVVQAALPADTLTQVTISRRYKGGEGHYCFCDDYAKTQDYTATVLYASAPAVVMHDKNAGTAANPKFTVKVVFPEALKNKGTFTLRYTYNGSTSDKTMQGDENCTFAVPSEATALSMSYSAFKTKENVNVTLFADAFRTDITRLSDVGLSVDIQKLVWTRVTGADGYRINGSTELSGDQTQYVHGVDSVGEYAYTVAAFSNSPFVLDSATDSCTVRKLATPTVAINSDGKLVIASTDTTGTPITVIDGTVTSCTDDDLRAVMTEKTSATLIARCVQESTPKAAYIASDDSPTYTLHRIADVTQENMNLTVDVAQNEVTWATIDHVSHFVCRLSRKASPSEEYTTREYTDATARIDGAALSDGLYLLSIKPVGTDEGTDLYLYLGDFAESTFRKDGVRAVTVSEGGAGFHVDGLVNTEGGYDVGWTLNVRYNRNEDTPVRYDFGLGTAVNLDERVQQYHNAHSSFSKLEFVFSVDYRNATDEQLSQSKTLPASDPYITTVSWKQSKSVENFTGNHVRTEVSEGVNTVKVTLTPDASVSLRPFERYGIVYRRIAFSNGTASLINKALGTEMTVDDDGIGGGKGFYLRVESDQYVTEDDGTFAYYRSIESANRYTVAIQTQLQYSIRAQKTGYEKSEESDENKLSAYCTLDLYNLTTDDMFDVEYLDDNGVWTRRYTQHTLRYATVVGSYRSVLLRFDEADNLHLTPLETEVRLRIRHCGYSETYDKYGKITYEDGAWQYCSFMVLKISED